MLVLEAQQLQTQAVVVGAHEMLVAAMVVRVSSSSATLVLSAVQAAR
jgi:hypothetical protein